jgi:hypothetical protein
MKELYDAFCGPAAAASASPAKSAPAAAASAVPPASEALRLWQKKLAFLQAEEAKTADAEQRFSIQQRIEEAQAKIQELGG